VVVPPLPPKLKIMPNKRTIQKILEANKEKGFVKRILNPEKYPTLPLGDGRSGTHLMSWGKIDDKYVVFPTILYDEGVGLRRFSPSEALSHVMQTDNFIEFNTPEEADWFSKNYKRVWGK